MKVAAVVLLVAVFEVDEVCNSLRHKPITLLTRCQVVLLVAAVVAVAAVALLLVRRAVPRSLL